LKSQKAGERWGASGLPLFMRNSAIFLLATALAARAADYQIQANIRYGLHPETVLDIVQSRAPALANRPGVVLFHAGGWVEGAKEDILEGFCIPLVEHGFVVANVEYRLAKAAPAPAAVEDALGATKWFQDHAAEYRVDPARIIAVGESAGGQLALMTGMLPASTNLGPVIKIVAVVDFYGVADVAAQVSGPNPQPYATAWIPEQPGRMDLARRMSPVTYVRKGLPPVLAIHGDGDPLVPYAQSVALVKALKAAGDEAELITVPGGGHGFSPEQMNKVWTDVFKWLKKRKVEP
jgi:acetyl esterase/lipase